MTDQRAASSNDRVIKCACRENYVCMAHRIVASIPSLSGDVGTGLTYSCSHTSADDPCPAAVLYEKAYGEWEAYGASRFHHGYHAALERAQQEIAELRRELTCIRDDGLSYGAMRTVAMEALLPPEERGQAQRGQGR